MLKQARDYRLFSRTAIPFVAIYTAGFVIGRAVYFAVGRLDPSRGPLGELRRAFIDTARARPYPSSVWMDWFSVALFGWVLLAELGRHQGRRVVGSGRSLLAGYSIALLCALAVVLSPHVPEAIYGSAAVVAAALLVSACWPTWPSRVRIAAVGLVAMGMGMAVFVLRLRDLARLGRLG